MISGLDRESERLTQQRGDIISGAGGGGRSSSILSPADGDSNVNVITENITRSLDALAEQPLRLEITMINDKGERKTYNVENNGKIITPMNY
jgi:hypothetical protein